MAVKKYGFSVSYVKNLIKAVSYAGYAPKRVEVTKDCIVIYFGEVEPAKTAALDEWFKKKCG